MRVRPYALAALTFAVLAGCAASVRPITEDDVRSGVKVTTGDASCPSCSKIKTYSSRSVIRATTRYSNAQATGMINAKVDLVVTNQTEDHVPAYELVAEFTNSGSFADNTDLYIRGGDKLKAVGSRQRAQCWSNLGSGCSWVQAYSIDAARIEKALSDGDVDLFIGKRVEYSVMANDGYSQRSVMKSDVVGMDATIPHAAIVGFMKGLQDKGADVPTSGKELDQRLTKKFEAADAAAAAQEKVERDRPLKEKVGARLCRQVGAFIDVGFVEDLANGKVKIRIADAILPGNSQVHAGGFHEQVVWDNPDAWFLCGTN